MLCSDTAKLSAHCSKLSQCRCTTYTHFHYVDRSSYLLLGSYFTYRSYYCYNTHFFHLINKKRSPSFSFFTKQLSKKVPTVRILRYNRNLRVCSWTWYPIHYPLTPVRICNIIYIFVDIFYHLNSEFFCQLSTTKVKWAKSPNVK